MKAKIGLMLAAALVLSLCTVCPQAAETEKGGKEVKVTLQQLPKAVKATLLREVGNGTIDEIEKSKENGKTVYSADITKDGKKYDVDIAANGTLLKTESEKAGEEKSENATKDKEGDEKE